MIYMSASLHETDPLTVGFMTVAAGFQHLVVFVKYSMPNTHAFLLVGLEIWFQLEAYYALTYTAPTVKVGTAMLLISHYSEFPRIKY